MDSNDKSIKSLYSMQSTHTQVTRNCYPWEGEKMIENEQLNQKNIWKRNTIIKAKLPEIFSDNREIQAEQVGKIYRKYYHESARQR